MKPISQFRKQTLFLQPNSPHIPSHTHVSSSSKNGFDSNMCQLSYDSNLCQENEKPGPHNPGQIEKDFSPNIHETNYSTERKVFSSVENERPDLGGSGLKAMDGDVVPPIIAYPEINASRVLLCAETAMGYDNGYIRIPRSLLEDPRFKDAPPAWRIILIEIINRAAVFAHDFNDHSEIIRIEIGEICFSIDMIAKFCGAGISHKQVERALAYFKKVKISGQRAGHRRSIIKIIHEETYDLISKQGGTRRGTSAGQARDISKECIERKEGKKERIKKKSAAASVAVAVEKIEKIKLRETVSLSQQQIDTAKAKFGEPLFEAMCDRLNSYKLSNEKEYSSDYGLFVKGSWLIDAAKKTLETPAQPAAPNSPISGLTLSEIKRRLRGCYTVTEEFGQFVICSLQGYLVEKCSTKDSDHINKWLKSKKL